LPIPELPADAAESLHVAPDAAFHARQVDTAGATPPVVRYDATGHP
jgi:hypothetical protein